MSNLHRILLLLASAVCLHAAPPAPASGHDIYKGVKYDYPPQSGFEHINKTDPQRNVLRDGRVGASGAGGVWGAWNKKDFTVDWHFDRVVRVREIEFTVIHSFADDRSHPGRLVIYAAPLDGATFPVTPVFSAEIPFETGSLQTVRIALPGSGVVAEKLRTVFEARRYQTVLSEVNFVAEPETDKEVAAVASRAQIPSGAKLTYEYPAHTRKGQREHIVKTDPRQTVLTDGKAGTAGSQAVWGAWGGGEMIVDWSFPTTVRVKAMRVSIVHPKPEAQDTHASAIRVYGSVGKIDFQREADWRGEIPFESGALQEARIAITPDGVVGNRIRTVFEPGRRAQVVLSEVSFETESVTPEEADAAQQTRVAGQPEVFAPVSFSPRSLSPEARVTGNPMFGMCGHFLHTDFFMPGAKPGGFSSYWKPEYTLPWMVDGNFGWVREPLYMALFRPTASGRSQNGRTVGENRRKVEEYLALYQARGIKVLLCPMYGNVGKGDTQGFGEFAEWIGSLARRFECVRAVELHNEPNITFWRGTPQEFVDASRQLAAAVKKEAPQVVIVAGSFAGWGSAWEHKDLTALVAGPREIATKYAEEVFRLGLLEFADAVSAHPYRGSSAPEGGDVIEAREDPAGFEKEIRRYLDLAANHAPGGKRLPLYLTEIGYSVSHHGYSAVSDEARQADYLSRLFLMLFSMKLEALPIEGIFWYDLKQDEREDSHYESNFGLISPDASRPRPAWHAARRIATFFDDDGRFRPVSLPHPPAFSNGHDLIKHYVWRRANDGALILPFWRLNQLQKKDADFDSELTLALPEGFSPGRVILHDLHENQARTAGFSLSNGVLRVPLHVTARAAWLELERSEK
ncbi:hypothetical protein Ga0100231_018430 [Opitutaceae bacterium TAV4]|nr:hypothetical protein Ga0100231_018430 [Opitutaceae bacterium TAV4]